MKIDHYSVLRREIVQTFAPLHCSTFVDGTLGAGGHASAILEAHPEIERFIALDQDAHALELAQSRLTPWQDKMIALQGNFANLREILASQGIDSIDGILVDLGVSSMQLDTAERGFSFMRDGPLDMRMDASNRLSAAEIVNHWPEREIGRILRDYGEEKQWRAAARAIVTARANRPITTTLELTEVLMSVVGWRRHKGSIHPATLIFQGLRIAVNDELGVLSQFLPDAVDALAPGGRIAVISFHSLEDRLIKNYFRLAASDKVEGSGIGGIFIDKKPRLKLLCNRPITAQADELELNIRSRSAKLRIAEKLV